MILSYVSGSNLDYTSMVPCFTPGTRIDTPAGPHPVEVLRVGDLVSTATGAQPLRWIARRDLSAQDLDLRPYLRPIRIAAGALGPGLPCADLRVSPQHRILVRSRIVARIAERPARLVTAKTLLGLQGISVDTGAAGVRYIHLLFDRHEILRANGAEAESRYLGTGTMRALPRPARHEIDALFPNLVARSPKPAALFLSGRKARRLAARHGKAKKPLQGDAPLAVATLVAAASLWL